MIYPDGGEMGFVEGMMIESVEEGGVGSSFALFFFSDSTFLALCFFVKVVHLNGRENVLSSLYSGNADRPLGTFNLSFFSKELCLNE